MADYVDVATLWAEDVASAQDCDHLLAEATIVVLESTIAAQSSATWTRSQSSRYDGRFSIALLL
jgi:hypothetical protein